MTATGPCPPAILRKPRNAASPPTRHMAEYWQPTAAGYFGRVSKGLILKAVAEGIGKPAADKIAVLKKDAMASRAASLLDGKGWLPAILRQAS